MDYQMKANGFATPRQSAPEESLEVTYATR